MRIIVAALLLAWIGALSAQDRQKILIDRQTAADGNIRVLDALYGQDDRVCRAQSEVARRCDGRSQCEILADDTLCGNPYANVNKQLFIGYSCGSDRRSVSVDEGQVAWVYCLTEPQPETAPAASPTTASSPPDNWRRGRLYIARAAYGAGNWTCDATRAFSYECDGQQRCQIEAGNGLCGDPAEGTRKEAVAEYWCNGNLERQGAA